jgi:hypothetical protein
LGIQWTLVGCALVLSNFYRGENISELSAPLRIKPLTSFAELLKLNYSIYSKIFVGKEELLYLDLSDRPDLYNSSLANEYTFYGLYSNVHPKGDNNKRREMIRNPTRFDPEETLLLARAVFGVWDDRNWVVLCTSNIIII